MRYFIFLKDFRFRKVFRQAWVEENDCLKKHLMVVFHIFGNINLDVFFTLQLFHQLPALFVGEVQREGKRFQQIDFLARLVFLQQHQGAAYTRIGGAAFAFRCLGCLCFCFRQSGGLLLLQHMGDGLFDAFYRFLKEFVIGKRLYRQGGMACRLV